MTNKQHTMRIIRKHYDVNGNLVTRSVVKSNATLKDFQDIQGRAWAKCEWSSMDLPNLTNWLKRCIVKTKNGNHLEFTLTN